jgi:hypothetical protein
LNLFGKISSGWQFLSTKGDCVGIWEKETALWIRNTGYLEKFGN